MSIETQLNTFISENLLAGNQPGPINPDENLLLSGFIDSLGVMQLVKYIEDEFAIDVAPGEVTLKNFKTINAIKAYIGRKTGEAA